MAKYSISIEMLFDDDNMDINDMEKLVDEKLQEVFNTFENITIKINRDTESNLCDSYRTSNESITKYVNMDTNEKYDF